MERIRDKVAIVTGASSGIGRHTALRLASLGAQLTLAARHPEALELLAQEIREFGNPPQVVPTDVTSKDQVCRLVDEAVKTWGRVDILVSNAGKYIRAPIFDLKPEHLEESLAVNFFGHVYAAQAVLPYMVSQKSGHIVLVSTMDAKKAIPPDAPYVIAKHALSGYGELLRQELHGTGVYTSVIYPGRVDTRMIEHLGFLPISAKLPPDRVARTITRAIQTRQVEVILPFQAKLLYYLNVFFPSLADTAVRWLKLSGWERNGGKPG
jgi:NADP-dependent 3-hydroxy acid dehydrogenase YdfG